MLLGGEIAYRPHSSCRELLAPVKLPGVGVLWRYDKHQWHARKAATFLGAGLGPPQAALVGADLCALTVAVSAVEGPDEGGGHPDGCGQDDGEREEERGSDGWGRAVLRGRTGRVVHHFRRGPADGGARADARSVKAASKPEVLPWPRNVTGSP